MLDFIFRGVDAKSAEHRAVLAMFVDMSKAFNRIQHAKLITMLADIGVPSCAILLLMSYLTERRMSVVVMWRKIAVLNSKINIKY